MLTARIYRQVRVRARFASSSSTSVTLVEGSGEGRATIRSCNIASGKHSIVSDVDLTKGGADLGMSPKQLVMAGLASCTAMTIRSVYQFKKQSALDSSATTIWDDSDLSGIKVTVSEHGDHPHIPSKFSIEVSFEGQLVQEAKDQLFKAAGNCPVKKLIAGGTPIESSMT
jgi:uncharacterized OsmC-like protein